MLEGGDRTVGIGEGGSEMGEDLRRGPTRGIGRELGRRAASRKGRADRALAPVEPPPDALEGPVAPRGVDDADGGGDAADNGALEKSPPGAGGQTPPSNFVGEPDAEGPPAAVVARPRWLKVAGPILPAPAARSRSYVPFPSVKSSRRTHACRATVNESSRCPRPQVRRPLPAASR